MNVGIAEIVKQKVVQRSDILNPHKWRTYQSQIGNITAFLQINATFNNPMNDSGASCYLWEKLTQIYCVMANPASTLVGPML